MHPADARILPRALRQFRLRSPTSAEMTPAIIEASIHYGLRHAVWTTHNGLPVALLGELHTGGHRGRLGSDDLAAVFDEAGNVATIVCWPRAVRGGVRQPIAGKREKLVARR